MTEVATLELARARAARIRAGIQNYLHTLADIAAAYAQRDWTALGYADWQAYVDGEYSEHRLKLTAEHRQKAVAELRLAGMSTRAIGSALGVSDGTVRNDLTGAQLCAPAEIQGADGKTYAATRPQTPAPMPEPEPEASTFAGSGHDHPHPAERPADQPQAHVRLPQPGAGDPLPADVAAQIEQRIAEKVARNADVAAHNAWVRELDEQIPAETKAEVAELGRRITPVTAVESGCRFLLDAVRGVNPELAVSEAPAELRHRLDVVHEALEFLTRVADAMKPTEVAA